ncbi:hypothetical protein A2276_06890 [candidate division WOR-1 bacterium RIFOXYA12_FULL_43_27]|uniref:Radical SAM core domain-containing protein n=1 Tax=candidate division WOR-1 bacterium RIFOXYC2_FULL_46_14 TaxID=1802587 RepID=A0A1F4U5S1_UNCSA|nr:MAG: hypothetical protein A2276_06890 [candidate division WOR-1 bacterium RIFOXYA12_FULL_43_27]OGC20373.1 MAG: hypothetical protein A2292_04890 [candidate division WOR-1 bacterium RIFOXYB2_FULL_46_45]OGC31890.1 MAG: hypothetical protein A2232_06560 [candidate division WOR-1 bacterium RIFOXYA2_FULL_46_56]OGC40219.1 MAG: hypothetical protein A2438_02910 [candidate division WOR-1 bacterium RIFOXYC2_FULL_46_14]
MKYIYGPVPSWRLGSSLGIDLISGEKYCTFGCNYCQLGPSPAGKRASLIRKVFIPTAEIIKEFDSLPKELYIDYITFSGSGEPTLASNLAEVAGEIKKRSKVPIALLTNSSLLQDPGVRRDLAQIDLILAKLDASNAKVFNKVNHPVPGIVFERIVEGIKAVKALYPEKLALQVMFSPVNKEDAEGIARLSKEIGPIKVFIGTPVRESADRPLGEKELGEIEKLFKPLKTVTVYSGKRPETSPLNEAETLKRRPKRRDER